MGAVCVNAVLFKFIPTCHCPVMARTDLFGAAGNVAIALLAVLPKCASAWRVPNG